MLTITCFKKGQKDEEKVSGVEKESRSWSSDCSSVRIPVCTDGNGNHAL